MSEEIIYHEYKIGNKIKKIKTLAGLKRYSIVNKDNVLTFSELLIKNDFHFRHNLKAEPISCECRLCNKNLPIFKIDEAKLEVLVSLCPCSVDTPLAINKRRFTSIFTEAEVEEVYRVYCDNKMKKWTTAGIPVASLDFKIKKFGEEEGAKKYKEACKKFNNVSVSYFAQLGYSKEDAEQMCRERQATFSLEKCISRHGEEGGKKVWQTRQDKWQATLNAKPSEEIERINQDKVWKSGNVSKISQRLFEQINCLGSRWGNRRSNNLGEKYFDLGSIRCLVDFCKDNKIIEFFGDYWHANPKKYNKDFLMTRRRGATSAENIWCEDSIRINALKKAGYDVMVVWENDFKKTPEKVIEECKKFLNN